MKQDTVFSKLLKTHSEYRNQLFILKGLTT